MSPRLSLPALAVVGVWLCAAAAAAEAQQLDLSAYVGSGDNVTRVSAENELDQLYLGFQGNVSFERERPRHTLSTRLGAALRWFPDSGQFLTMDRSASVGVDARLTAATRLKASQTVQYSPYRQFGPSIFPAAGVGELPLYNPDGAATFGESFYDFGSLLEVSHRLSERTTVAIDYRFRLGVADGASELPVSHRAGVGLRRVVGQYAALKLGTAYRFSRTGFYVTDLPTRAIDFDIGIDYNRPLSFSRGTTLSFSSGTALISRSATATDPGELGRQFVGIAAVTLSQAIGRHWEAQLGADRNLQYVDGFADPFYATRFTGRLSGQIGRTVTALASANYSTGGGIGTSILSQNFDGFQAEARLNYRVARRWQLFGAYYFTENRLSPDSLRNLPLGTVLRPNQASVQIGVNFSID